MCVCGTTVTRLGHRPSDCRLRVWFGACSVLLFYLKLGRFSELLPLLDDVVPVDVAELHPELTDDAVFGESIEVEHLHHRSRLQEGGLGYLGKDCAGQKHNMFWST